MTDDILDRAREALTGVTEGLWECDFSEETLEQFKAPAIWLGDGDLGALIQPHHQDEENAHFIAAARSLVPELIDALTAARAQNAQLREAVERARTECWRIADGEYVDDGEPVVARSILAALDEGERA